MSLWTAFLLGLVGSLHCAGMCGPLVLALPSQGGRASFLTGRVAYNIGRVITYCLLGLLFGLIGRSLWVSGVQQWASIILGLLLLAGLCSSRITRLSGYFAKAIAVLKQPMGKLLRSPSFYSMGLLGLLNGLLPCGLVYVAGAAATTTNSPAQGALYMAAFGLGTIPMLFAIGSVGRLFPAPLRLKVRKAIPISVAFLSALLILRGMSLGIPYVSPDLSGPAPSCCHN